MAQTHVASGTRASALANQTAERVLALQREVWALRRKVREQTARAELWRHRALLKNDRRPRHPSPETHRERQTGDKAT